MIYICIPAHNEEQTVGVVLWKIRQVMADFPRDYQLLVVDDASTDKTAEVLAPYARVLPLTVVRTESRQGEGAALEMMLREAVRRSQYPRRDVIVTLQADFTQEPDELISLIKRTEAGADIVVGEVPSDPKATRGVRWSRALARRVLGRKRIPEGVSDPFTSYRAYRVFAVRKALEERGGRLVHWSGWAGAAELLLATAPHARRVDTIPLVERRERLQRPSRMLPWPALKSVWSLAREAKPLVVASPAELDEAMRAVAAVRTSEVVAAREGAGRTQRGEARRGTTEERARKSKARRDAREVAEGRTRNGDGRRERRPRQDRTEGAERRPQAEAGEARPRTEGTTKRPRRERTARPKPVEPTLDAETVGPLPADPLLAAIGQVADGAEEPARKKRKRPRRRKKSAGAANGESPVDGEETTTSTDEGSVGESVEGSSEADAGDGVEGSPGEGEARPRRRRRGRRGGRRRTGSGAAAAAETESEAGGEISTEGGDAPRVPESREPESVPLITEGERNDA